MGKKIVGIIIILGIITLGLYAKYYYPNSQFQLKNSLRGVSGTAIDHFYNATEKSCGIWYERNMIDGAMVNGRSNNDVSRCFRDAFERCQQKNILLVHDQSNAQEKAITYSLIRIIRANDEGKCIAQNYYEQYSTKTNVESQIPLNYINTCTSLSENLLDSCEPQYIKEQKEKLQIE